MNNLYLDGCSYTYGQGLPREQSLGNLFNIHGAYTVFDNSRPGKSNLAIAMDAYQHWQDYDLFVLGFTYSSRFYIKYEDQNLDFFVNRISSNYEPAALNDAFLEVQKYFYTVFNTPYCDELSDMLIDGIISFLIANNKKVIPFSWEQRNTINTIYRPFIGPNNRLPDGHLDKQGTMALYCYLQNINGQE